LINMVVHRVNAKPEAVGRIYIDAHRKGSEVQPVL
jgi:hypothetical protein